MRGGINTAEAALKIVRVLHNEKIPMALIPSVFKESLEIIIANTVPYNPDAFKPEGSSVSQDMYNRLALQLVKGVAASAAAYGRTPAEK